MSEQIIAAIIEQAKLLREWEKGYRRPETFTDAFTCWADITCARSGKTFRKSYHAESLIKELLTATNATIKVYKREEFSPDHAALFIKAGVLEKLRDTNTVNISFHIQTGVTRSGGLDLIGCLDFYCYLHKITKEV